MIPALIALLAPFVGALVAVMMVDGLTLMVTYIAETMRADTYR